MFFESRIADCGLRIKQRDRHNRLRYPRPIVNRQSKIENGFSLAEIMIVIVIIGLLAGVVTVNVRRYLIKARQNVACQDIANIAGALDSFWAEYNRYPSNEEGLLILIEPTQNNDEPFLDRKSEPLDPWGNPYQYNSPGADNSPHEVISLGADAREGGSGADADISSEDLKR